MEKKYLSGQNTRKIKFPKIATYRTPPKLWGKKLSGDTNGPNTYRNWYK